MDSELQDTVVPVMKSFGDRLRKPKRLGDQVYTQILEQIISQGWPEDTKLPTESDYAREFGVSRPVVPGCTGETP